MKIIKNKPGDKKWYKNEFSRWFGYHYFEYGGVKTNYFYLGLISLEWRT